VRAYWVSLLADTSDDLIVGQIADTSVGGASWGGESSKQTLRVLVAPVEDGVCIGAGGR